MRTAESYSLIVQGKHCLSHFSTLLCYSLLGSFSTIDLILSGDLGAFVREPTYKEFFSYAELMGDVP